LDEDIWLKYVGAYKNLSENDEDDTEKELPIIPLVGRIKLSGTQVIDSDYILSLIGSKLENKEAKNQLQHTMDLMTKVLDISLLDMKKRFK